jgi:hypothetical protein
LNPDSKPAKPGGGIEKKSADELGEWSIFPGQLDLAELLRFGKILDRRPSVLRGQTIAMSLAEQLLQVRTREGATTPLKANAAQKAFEDRRGQRNIVLKARQMGFTTWAAARFFLKTITRPGTLTLEVAHTQESAEEIFRIVHRFLDRLPDQLREGPLKTSRANVRQIVFPAIDAQYRVVSAGDRNAGRGLTVQNLHCSELARWPGDPADILAGLEAALAPGAELILESTPDGVGGCFYDQWQKAGETRTVRHFFPWWMEPRYRAEAAEEASLTDEERALMLSCQLDLEQIGFRRQIRANFRGLATQEYAEDEQSCFLASGSSIFELAAIEDRLASAPEPSQRRRNGELELWFPPMPGKQYLVAVDRPAAAAKAITPPRKCWKWRPACSAPNSPAMWAASSWRAWLPGWPRNITGPGWSSRETITAAASWRWRIRLAPTGASIASPANPGGSRLRSAGRQSWPGLGRLLSNSLAYSRAASCSASAAALSAWPMEAPAPSPAPTTTG